MIRTLIAALVSTHRFFLVSGTVVLAVGTSRLADHACVAANWLLSACGVSLMLAGDLLLETDRVGTDLHRSSGQALRDSRVDIFNSRQPWAVVALLVAALASGAAALVA